MNNGYVFLLVSPSISYKIINGEKRRKKLQRLGALKYIRFVLQELWAGNSVMDNVNPGICTWLLIVRTFGSIILMVCVWRGEVFNVRVFFYFFCVFQLKLKKCWSNFIRKFEIFPQEWTHHKTKILFLKIDRRARGHTRSGHSVQFLFFWKLNFSLQISKFWTYFNLKALMAAICNC